MQSCVFICDLKVMEGESKLKESLMECELKCTVLEREKVEQSQTVRYAHETAIFHSSCKWFSLYVCIVGFLMYFYESILFKEVAFISVLTQFILNSSPLSPSQPATGGGEEGQVGGYTSPS